MKISNMTWITTLATVMIIAGAALLVLSTLPIENRLTGHELTVRFVIGKKVIDMKDAVVKPIPEDVNHNIIRVGGTSVGKKCSGNFKNTKTKTKYIFYLTGKGERTYFEIGEDKYLIDGVSVQ